jgi:hypothetical protein
MLMSKLTRAVSNAGTIKMAVNITVSSANPNYSLYDNAGANQISLLDTQNSGYLGINI